MAGGNKKASRHFFLQKNGGTKPQGFSSRFWRLAAKRQSQKLFTQNRRFSSHLHKTPFSLACEVVPH
jgi:hypothetical protein